jgi:hypothetical protein
LNCTMIKKTVSLHSMYTIIASGPYINCMALPEPACVHSTTPHKYMLNIRGYKVNLIPYFGCSDKRQIFRNYSSVPYHGQPFLNLKNRQFFYINVAFEFWQIFKLIINLFTNIVLKNKKDIWNPHNFLIK